LNWRRFNVSNRRSKSAFFLLALPIIASVISEHSQYAHATSVTFLSTDHRGKGLATEQQLRSYEDSFLLSSVIGISAGELGDAYRFPELDAAFVGKDAIADSVREDLLRKLSADLSAGLASSLE
jgi:hypothetical protein